MARLWWRVTPGYALTHAAPSMHGRVLFVGRAGTSVDDLDHHPPQCVNLNAGQDSNLIVGFTHGTSVIPPPHQPDLVGEFRPNSSRVAAMSHHSARTQLLMPTTRGAVPAYTARGRPSSLAQSPALHPSQARPRRLSLSGDASDILRALSASLNIPVNVPTLR